MSQPKLLITGISGFLGWHIQAILQRKSYANLHKNYQIYGTYYNHKPPLNHIKLIHINLTNYQDVKNLFFTIKPDAVIHTAAASQPNYCQLNPDISYQINVTATVNIAQLCAENQIPLIFTSTDLVFDGKNAPYTETSLVNPVNIYGEQKLLAEQKILDIYPQIAIARPSCMA
jgi:dTDP-4-dehydrorhamnose reductase